VSKTFKVGFIGAGGIAHAHAINLKKVDGVELVCAADVSAGGLAKFKEQQGVARTYADYKEMLAKETDLDAISVCTPNGLHAENTIASLEAGKHVIVEKPMAMNSVQGKAMVDAAKKAGKHLVIGFQYRFDPKTQLIKRQIDEGEFGKVLYVRCQALRRRGIPNWGVFGRKELQGGGPMIDIGVHVMEMAHFMMGSPKPVSASGNTYTYLGNKPMQAQCGWPNWDYKTYTVEDLAVGLIRFDNGATLSIEAPTSRRTSGTSTSWARRAARAGIRPRSIRIRTATCSTPPRRTSPSGTSSSTRCATSSRSAATGSPTRRPASTV
jgi:predicted dehydrogenase